VQPRDADRHADPAADQEREEPRRPYRPAQLPDGDSLHDQPVSHDQRGCFGRRQEMQPDRGGDDAKRETRHPGHECSAKGLNGKQGKVDNLQIRHRAPHPQRRDPIVAVTGQLLAGKRLRGGCR
jgi:hypothetical protein